jgi:phosphatidylinositol glycan class F
MRELHPLDQDAAFARWFWACAAVTQAAVATAGAGLLGLRPAALGLALVAPASLAAAPLAVFLCALLARWATQHPTAVRLPAAADPIRGDPSRGPLLRRIVLRFKRLVHRCRPIKTLLSGAFLLVAAWMLSFYVTICFGAPAFSAHWETGAFSALAVTFLVLPSVLVYGPEDRSSLLQVFFVDLSDSSPLAHGLFVSAACSALGAWIGAFPIPLDWDRDWQTWPITCVLGLYLGHFVGCLITLVSLELQRGGLSLNRPSKKKKV